MKIAGPEMQDTNPMQYIQLPSMMGGSYFDRMSVGKVKQSLEAQIAEAPGGPEEKGAQHGRESLRVIPQKK